MIAELFQDHYTPVFVQGVAIGNVAVVNAIFFLPLNLVTRSV